jgi:hypothetical protein
MNLVEIVALDFATKERSSGANVSDILSHAGSDQSILNPPIGPFDLALGLGREGIGHLQIPLLLRRGSPEVVGEIMLNQLTDVVG